MKKWMMMLLVVGMAVSMASAACAGTMKEKFMNGAQTFIHSPMNLPNSIQEEYKKGGFIPFAVVGGTMKGLFYFGKDLVSGLFQMVTFNSECFDK